MAKTTKHTVTYTHKIIRQVLEELDHKRRSETDPYQRMALECLTEQLLRENPGLVTESRTE